MIKKKKLEDLQRLSVDQFRTIDKLPVVIVLDNIRSAINVGSLFRTVDAFLCKQMILCGITATPPHKDILKSAIGASSSVSWIHHASTILAIKELKSLGYTIIGVEQTTFSVELQHYAVFTDQKYALVFGNEVDGLSDEILEYIDHFVEIPQYGTKHSLNVAVCAGIIMWHFCMPYVVNKV